MKFWWRVIACGLGLLLAASASAQETLVVYASLKEAAMLEIKAAFVRKHPEIEVELQVAGAARLMGKLAAESDTDTDAADVLWTSEIGDFLRLKAEKALLPYVPADIKAVGNPIADYDGSFTAARLATLGIAVNTRFVKESPHTWQDLTRPMFKEAFGLTNPAVSGTAYLAVAQLARIVGWSYFDSLHANGAHLGKGSISLIEETAIGDLLACLAVDHLVFEKMDAGAPLSMVYPGELIVIPSPIAILKRGRHNEAAKKFVDFVLSVEGQTLLANEGMLPVRADVNVPERYNLPKVADAVKRAAKIDYAHLLAERDATVRRFAETMQK